jgi:flagellar assembly factor FliW
LKINTANFGEIDIEEEKIIEFKDGIPGFENEKQFTVILNEDKDNPFHYLQSINNGELSFVIINPFEIFPEYDFEISDIAKNKLNIKNEKQVAVYTIVVIPEDIEKMTTNLQGPIVINVDERKGKQVILDDARYHARHRLFNSNPEKGAI